LALIDSNGEIRVLLGVLKEMDSELLKYAALTPFSPLLVAEFYALLGERKAALDWLEKALRLYAVKVP
jgi:hypothetical protein